MFNGRNNLRMAVANILTANTATKIYIAFAFNIPDFGILCFLRDEGRRIRDRSGNRLVAATFDFDICCHDISPVTTC